MHLFARPVGALFSFLLLMSAIQAEQSLDPVVVTATRQPSPIPDVLADVTVIDRDEIERNGGSSVVDLLARQPGMQLATTGGVGTATSFYLRGTRTDQVKILVDGLPINSLDLSGSPLRYLSLADLERIEILRGPGSTLYGADAIGGVIQLFTRRGSPGLKFDGFVGYGTQNTFQASSGISAGDDHWQFRAEAHQDSSDSISAQKNASNQDSDTDSYRNSGGAISVSFSPTKDHELGLIYRTNQGRSRYDNSPPNGTFDAYVDFNTEQWQIFSQNHISDHWNSKLQYGHTTDWQNNYASWAPLGSYLQTENTLVSWQNDIDLPLGKGLLGAERGMQQASPKESFIGNDSINNNAIFINWNAHYQSHRWQLGGRYDDHSQFGNQTTYSLGYGYQLTPQWRLQSSYGTSFKAPSLYQLYDQWSGNAQLKPEEGKNWELGIVWEQSQQTASVIYYLNQVSNMIDWSAASYRFQNVSQAKLTGVTLDYAAHFNDWGVHGVYDWLDANDEDTGFQLGRRAKNKILIDVSKTWNDLTTGMEWIAVGSRYNTNTETGRMGGYGVLNLTTHYNISKKLTLEGRINNLLDKNYKLVLDYNNVPYGTLGINTFIGIRYTPGI